MPDIPRLVSAIERHGVRFEVERLPHRTGPVTLRVAVEFPNVEIEARVYRRVEILRSCRTRVLKFLIARDGPPLAGSERPESQASSAEELSDVEDFY